MTIVQTEIVKIGMRAYGEYATKDYEDFCVGDLVRVQSIRNGIDDKVTGKLELITANQAYVRTKLCLVPIMLESIYHISKLNMEDLV
jgi:hypothetical protein